MYFSRYRVIKYFGGLEKMEISFYKTGGKLFLAHFTRETRLTDVCNFFTIHFIIRRVMLVYMYSPVELYVFPDFKDNVSSMIEPNKKRARAFTTLHFTDCYARAGHFRSRLVERERRACGKIKIRRLRVFACEATS